MMIAVMKRSIDVENELLSNVVCDEWQQIRSAQSPTSLSLENPSVGVEN